MSTRRLVSTLAFVSLLGGGSAASAQDDVTGEVSADASATVATPAPAPGGAFAFGRGTLGIGVVFPTGGDTNSANFLYLLDAQAALDLQLGFTLTATSDQMDPPIEGETTIGISLGGGYRMYRAISGRIRPFFEPGGLLDITDLSEAGDTLTLGVFAVLGVELVVLDQFTLGTALGAALTFSDSFDTTRLNLFTNPIVATFYW